MLNPPAIACTPDKYTESWHKDYGPRWNKKKSTEHQLYYFSPMLLLGAGGTVVSKALVGNEKKKHRSRGSSADKLLRETRGAPGNPESEVCYVAYLL